MIRRTLIRALTALSASLALASPALVKRLTEMGVVLPQGDRLKPAALAAVALVAMGGLVAVAVADA